MSTSLAERTRCSSMPQPHKYKRRIHQAPVRLDALHPSCLLRNRRHKSLRQCCSSSRVSMAAAGSANTGPHHPPNLWETLREAAESAVQEAEVMGRSVSSHVQGAVGTSVDQVKEFAASADIPGKIQEASVIVKDKVEEAAFESTREASRLCAKLKVSDHAEVAAANARQFMEELDCRWQLRQKLRLLQWEFFYYLRVVLRQLSFLKGTPFFPVVGVAFLFWLVHSGIMGQIFMYTIWTIPFLPALARTAARAALVEGDCPSCGQHFIGPKKMKFACRQCREVVWEPEKKGGSDPLVVVDFNPDGSVA